MYEGQVKNGVTREQKIINLPKIGLYHLSITRVTYYLRQRGGTDVIVFLCGTCHLGYKRKEQTHPLLVETTSKGRRLYTWGLFIKLTFCLGRFYICI